MKSEVINFFMLWYFYFFFKIACFLVLLNKRMIYELSLRLVSIYMLNISKNKFFFDLRY